MSDLGSPLASAGTAFVEFYRDSKLDNFHSQESGLPVHKAVDMVLIWQPGALSSTKREVTELDRRRWASQWAAYQQNMEQRQDGTPLDVMFPKNPEVVKTLQGFHIWTIQALAALPDSENRIPFVADHKKRAKEYLDGAAKGAKFHQLEKRLEDAEMSSIAKDDLIKTLSDRLTALEAKKE